MHTTVIFLTMLFAASTARGKEESVKKQLKVTETEFTEIQSTDKPARIQVKPGQELKVNQAPEVRNPIKSPVRSKVNRQTTARTAIDAARTAATQTAKQNVNKTLTIKADANEGALTKAGVRTRKTPSNFTDEFVESLNQLSDELRSYLDDTSFQDLQEAARSVIAVNLPQAGIFGDLVGLRTTGLSSIAFLIFIGWPVLLGLLYVALIVIFPNRRSDNAFEKHLSTVVETMSHMMYTAEDKFLDFLEHVTDPGEPYGDSYGSYSEFHPAYAYPPDQHDRQEVIYKPTAYYDEYGAHFDAEEDFGDDLVDSWGIKDTPSFVDPQGVFQNPVASYNTATASGPLREQYGGDLSSLGNNFELQNEIANKDKHNFVNVILGTQYQHSRPSGSLTDQGIIQGTVATEPSNRPAPPKGYRPSRISAPSPSSSASSSFKFETDKRPREEPENPSDFRPSKLENPHTGEFEDHWRAGPYPLTRKNNTRIRFPEARLLRQRQNEEKEEEPLEIILIDEEEST